MSEHPLWRVARLGRRHSGVLAVALVALAAASMIEAVGWNQNSHYALVRSLDRGTPRIDRYRHTTGDVAAYHGHWFSSRAPGLALATTPFYAATRAAGIPGVTHKRVAGGHNDEMVWVLGLWGAVLPALILLLLVRNLAERVEPGFGTAAAVTLGLGSLILPFAAMLFSHVFSAMLGFAAFAVLWRWGTARILPLALAGLMIGFGITTEYPILFVGLILGVYVLAVGEASLRARLGRALAYAGGVVVGVVPLAAYDRWAFGSFTHIAYADIPKQHAGFFGIRVPNPAVAVELLLSSRGLLTLAPVLAMAAAGCVLLHRRGHRAEALVISAVALVFLAYNSGYYLPYGGTVPGPRFLITILPFLGVPLALAFRRFPAPTIALAAASIVGIAIPTITKPMVSAEGDTGIWMQLLDGGNFQATIANAAGVRGHLLALGPFLLPAAMAIAIVASVTREFAVSWRAVASGLAVAGGWALFAAFGPAAFGIDHGAGSRIVAAGDPKGVLLPYGAHPITGIALIGLVAAALALIAARAFRGEPQGGTKLLPAYGVTAAGQEQGSSLPAA
ncbi:MAG: hypothetical protein NVSMB25_08630 [Thermoleophilaceae bacterium]